DRDDEAPVGAVLILPVVEAARASRASSSAACGGGLRLTGGERMGPDLFARRAIESHDVAAFGDDEGYVVHHQRGIHVGAAFSRLVGPGDLELTRIGGGDLLEW